MLRLLKASLHPVNIRHGPAQAFLRNLQAEGIAGLQKLALRLHKSLAQSPVGCLPEVSSLCVLEMGAARNQGDFHIRDGRAYEDAPVLPLLQVGEDQPLPVPIQIILADRRRKLQAAAPLSRLQKQMDLRVVPEGLIMSHPLHGIPYGFLVHNISRVKGHLRPEPLPDQLS